MSQSKLGETFLFGLLVLLIGSIVRIGASIYLPALPLIGKEFGIGSAMMSNTITIYFLVFSFFIIIAGVLSDRYGRKPLLVVGMLFFFIGSSLCSMSSSYESLMLGRAIQAFGASMIPGTLMAMIQDACEDTRAIFLIGWLAVLGGLFLVAAPMIGGVLTHLFGWRSNFWFLSLFTFIVFFITLFFITETHEQRVSLAFGEIFKVIFTILTSSQFILVLLPTILFFSLQGVFLASAPYIVMQEYGLTPVEFGMSNIFLVLGLFAGRYVGAAFFKKCHAQCVYRYGTVGLVIAAILFVLYGYEYLNGLWWFLTIIAVFTFNFGMISPINMRTSIAAFQTHSGIASALQGALLLGASAVGSFVIGSLIHTLSSMQIGTLFGLFSGVLSLSAAVTVFVLSLRS